MRARILQSQARVCFNSFSCVPIFNSGARQNSCEENCDSRNDARSRFETDIQRCIASEKLNSKNRRNEKVGSKFRENIVTNWILRGFSDDDQSDISLDELTDEEQEDLRAQLNKNKEPVVRF